MLSAHGCSCFWASLISLMLSVVASQECHADECQHASGTYKELLVNSTDWCCSACTADARCIGWIFSPAGSSNCHLKDDIGHLNTGCKGSSCHPCSVVRSPAPSPPPPPAPKGAKNVLLLISDDFRPDLPVYGNELVHAPNINERLAGEGVTLLRAHIQISYCCPSRNSFMSGRRPDVAQAWNFLTNYPSAPKTEEWGSPTEWSSMPGWFKKNGFWTAGTGKLYHNGVGYNKAKDWSQTKYVNSDGHLTDTSNTDVAIANLREGAKHQPFFVGMGFHKPHLPWVYPTKQTDKGCCPRKYYPANVSEIPPAAHPEWPKDTNPIAWHQCAEMATEFYKPFSLEEVSERRVNYYSALSYVDWNIGRLLDTLDSLGLANNTAVVFFGDHGWQLGEHNMWCKMSVFELGTRIPLIFRAPWLGSESQGKLSTALAEAVDVFPTLAELAGVPVPAEEKLQGQSLVPVLKSPETASVKDVALSQFPRCWQNETQVNHGKRCGDENNKTNAETNMCDCHWAPAQYIDFMGYSMRTAEWRYTEWVRWNKTGPFFGPIWDDVFAVELWDHRSDTGVGAAAKDDFENANLASLPKYADIRRQLAERLRVEVQRWRPQESAELVV